MGKFEIVVIDVLPLSNADTKKETFYCEGIDKLNFAQKCHNQCDICLALKAKRGGKREGSGRKKGTNEPFLVRCHPTKIKEVREFAKNISKIIEK
jgi:hypothetical protein